MAYASGGALASEVSLAGGFGFISPGKAWPLPMQKLCVVLRGKRRATFSLRRRREIQERVRHRAVDARQALWSAPHRGRFSRVEARGSAVSARPPSRTGTREWRAGDLVLLRGGPRTLDRARAKPRSEDWQISEDPRLRSGQFRRRRAVCRTDVEGRCSCGPG